VKRILAAKREAMQTRLLLIPLFAIFVAGCSSMDTIEEYAKLSSESVGVSCWSYSTYDKSSPEGGSVLIAASAVNQAAASLCDEPPLAGIAPGLAEVRYSMAAKRFIENKKQDCELVKGEELTLLHSEFEYVCIERS
jgi:hypothetical protein